jgi:hypothetical protein
VIAGNAKDPSTSLRLTALLLRLALLVALFSAGWIVYQKLPVSSSTDELTAETTLQIVLRQSPDLRADSLDIPVELYPVDIAAVRHEFFTERRAGKRFDDFLSERMNGRAPINAKLDKQGRGFVVIRPGSWWIHAVLSGEEDLEWHLPVNIAGRKQSIELTAQNAYARTKSF